MKIKLILTLQLLFLLATTQVYGQTIESKSGCVSGNCKNGFGVFVYPNGNRYEGNWLKGKRSGEGLYLSSFKGMYSISKGGWLKGYKHGYDVMQYEDGEIFIQNWEKGVLSGRSRKYNSSGFMVVDDEYYNGRIKISRGIGVPPIIKIALNIFSKKFDKRVKIRTLLVQIADMIDDIKHLTNEDYKVFSIDLNTMEIKLYIIRDYNNPFGLKIKGKYVFYTYLTLKDFESSLKSYDDGEYNVVEIYFDKESKTTSIKLKGDLVPTDPFMKDLKSDGWSFSLSFHKLEDATKFNEKVNRLKTLLEE